MAGDITIELNVDQRFIMESNNDEAFIMVDSITIFPENRQISFNGSYFGTDFKEMKVDPFGKASMVLSLDETAINNEED